eukprot:scaffold15258_cov111-Isochrysis_galbana.AAC.3
MRKSHTAQRHKAQSVSARQLHHEQWGTHNRNKRRTPGGAQDETGDMGGGDGERAGLLPANRRLPAAARCLTVGYGAKYKFVRVRGAARARPAVRWQGSRRV